MVVNLVAGLGETGSALYEILNDHEDTGRYDPKKKIDDCKERAQVVHICIPFNDSFEDNLESIWIRFEPNLIIIHPFANLIDSRPKGVERELVPKLFPEP